MPTSATEPRAGERGRTARRAGERGWALVEALWTALIISVAVGALLGSLEAALRGVHGVERKSTGMALAQRWLEDLRSRPWAELANCSGQRPVHAADPHDPRVAIVDGDPPRLRVLASTRAPGEAAPVVAGTPVGGEEIVLGTGAACLPGGGADAVGDVTDRLYGAQVYRFVSWVDEPCSSTLVTDLKAGVAGRTDLVPLLSTTLQSRIDQDVAGLCTGARDAKRLTVAIVLPGSIAAAPRLPLVLSTIVPDPAAGVDL